MKFKHIETTKIHKETKKTIKTFSSFPRHDGKNASRGTAASKPKSGMKP